MDHRSRPQRAWYLLLLLGAACSSPASPSFGTRTEDLVYGEDGRRDAYAVGSDEVEARAALASSVALMREGVLQRRRDGRIDVVAETWAERANLCPGEAFAEQPAAASCSGTLVGDDLVLTAGHCALRLAPCDRQEWAFAFAMEADGVMPELRASDVYGCRSIPASRWSADEEGRRWDYAWVELDRDVDRDWRRASLGTRGPAVGDALTVVGYPGGVPVKVETNARVVDARSDRLDYFSMDSDTFDGSSGSGVFDEQGRLVGVFVRGGHDYEQDADGACLASRHIAASDDPTKAEQASYLAAAISDLCAAGWPDQRLCPPSLDAVVDAGPRSPNDAGSVAVSAASSGCALGSAVGARTHEAARSPSASELSAWSFLLVVLFASGARAADRARERWCRAPDTRGPTASARTPPPTGLTF